MKWSIRSLFVKEPSPDQFRVDDHAVACRMRDRKGTEPYSSPFEDESFLIQTAKKMKPVNDFLESQGYAVHDIGIGDGTGELTHTGDVAYTRHYGAQEGFLAFYRNGAKDYRRTFEEKKRNAAAG